MFKVGDVVQATTHITDGLSHAGELYGVFKVPKGSVGIVSEIVQPPCHNRNGGEFYVTFFHWPDAPVDVWGAEIAPVEVDDVQGR